MLIFSPWIEESCSRGSCDDVLAVLVIINPSVLTCGMSGVEGMA